MSPISVPPSLSFLAPRGKLKLIRVGRSYDGGYVVPLEAILSTETLLSFGLSRDWSFEEDFLRIGGCRVVHGYDHTVSMQVFLLELVDCLLKLLVFQKGLRSLWTRVGVVLSYRRFFRSKKDLCHMHFRERIVGGEVSGDQSACLGKVFARVNTAGLVFMKMDIEGAEYCVLREIKPYVSRLAGLVVEFHETSSRRTEFITLLTDLLCDFSIVHFHADNCADLGPDYFPLSVEITLINREHFHIEDSVVTTRLPLPELDMPNDPKKVEPDFIF